MSTDVSCMLPVRFSNSSNIISCLLLMASKAQHRTVVKIINTSKAVRYNMVECDTSGLKSRTTFIAFSV
jgi:hypothetical protein